jgi:hypothetical protein
MGEFFLLRLIKGVIAAVICIIALLLPYRLRLFYTDILAFFLHLPYVVFGKITRHLFTRLRIDPHDIEWQ